MTPCHGRLTTDSGLCTHDYRWTMQFTEMTENNDRATNIANAVASHGKKQHASSYHKRFSWFGIIAFILDAMIKISLYDDVLLQHKWDTMGFARYNVLP